MTEKDLNDIYFCRIPLEGLAAACAARHANDGDLAFLADAIAGMEAELRASDPHAFFDANVQFLDRIHHLSENPILLRILSVIEKHALRYRYLAHIERPEMLTLSLDGFRRIYDAIASREAGAAEQRTISVMRDAQRVISAALRERLDAEQA
jgi:GntR family transcriptional regulator, rspAB operon transcriptional repressor